MIARHPARLLALLATCGSIGLLMPAESAHGQGLQDRINHFMQRRAQSERRNQSKARMLGVLLYTDMSVQFDETPAREAINYLRTALGINIVGRFNDDRAGAGIDPEFPITLDVSDRSALTVLELVLDQCGDDLEECTWQLRRGYVEVGTKDRLGARNSQEIRYYPIRDLLFEPPHYDNAPDLDLDSALSQGGGGGGGGRGGGGGGGGFGGGGGGGGRGGGGGGGGGGGSLFGTPTDDPERLTEIEQADQIVELILQIVEPDGWIDNGGEWGTIKYYQGTLIIRAPDFMHRQIGGYPFAIRPTRGAASASVDRRYVTFTGSFSQVEITGLESQPFGGAAGGGGGQP